MSKENQIDLINPNKNWKGGNTEVDVMGDSPCKTRTNIYQHGNHIAIVQTFRNWPTPTTRSRLRSLGIDTSIENGCAMLDGEEV